MSLVLTSGPAVEPITLAEAKAHLRLDTTADDLPISALVTAARVLVERHIDGALISQAWSLYVDAPPKDGVLAIPIAPVQALTAVRLHKFDGGFDAVLLDRFQLDAASSPPRIVFRNSLVLPALRPANGIEFALLCGYGETPAHVPAPIRQALLMLIALLYEHRDPAEFADGTRPMPAAVASLLSSYRAPRLV